MKTKMRLPDRWNWSPDLATFLPFLVLTIFLSWSCANRARYDTRVPTDDLPEAGANTETITLQPEKSTTFRRTGFSGLQLSGRGRSEEGNQFIYPLLKFELSDVPSGAQLQDAWLILRRAEIASYSATQLASLKFPVQVTNVNKLIRLQHYERSNIRKNNKNRPIWRYRIQGGGTVQEGSEEQLWQEIGKPWDEIRYRAGLVSVAAEYQGKSFPRVIEEWNPTISPTLDGDTPRDLIDLTRFVNAERSGDRSLTVLLTTLADLTVRWFGTRRNSLPSNYNTGTFSPPQLKVRYKPQPELRVQSNQEDSSLIINNRNTGSVGKSKARSVKLEPGTHSVRVEKEGYLSWQKKIQLEYGEEQKLRASLEKIPEPAWRRVSPGGDSKDVAVVQIADFPWHHNEYNPLSPYFSRWQKGASSLNRVLSRNADLFAYGYPPAKTLSYWSTHQILHDKVKALQTSYDRVELVGDGVGGLVARYFVQEFPNAGVDRVIQVAAPNNGYPRIPERLGDVPNRVRPLLRSVKNGSDDINQLNEKLIPSGVEFVHLLDVGPVETEEDSTDASSTDFLPRTSQYSDSLLQQGIPPVPILSNTSEGGELMNRSNVIGVLRWVLSNGVPRKTEDVSQNLWNRIQNLPDVVPSDSISRLSRIAQEAVTKTTDKERNRPVFRKIGDSTKQKNAFVLLRNVPRDAFRPDRDYTHMAYASDWQESGSDLVQALTELGQVFRYSYPFQSSVKKWADHSLLKKEVDRLARKEYWNIVLIGRGAGGLVAKEFVLSNPKSGVSHVVMAQVPHRGGNYEGVYPQKSRRVLPPAFNSFLDSVSSPDPNASSRSIAELTDRITWLSLAGIGTGSEKTDGPIAGDGIVPFASQYPDLHRKSGIPFVPIHARHFGSKQIMRRKRGLTVISRLLDSGWGHLSPEKVTSFVNELRSSAGERKKIQTTADRIMSEIKN